jgi:mannose-6-phosphate isomerase-like protein (cupin superfamily)
LSERQIVCEDLNRAIDELRREGFRIEIIYPADDPYMAVMSHDGEAVRLTTRPDAQPPSAELPPFQPEFVLTRAGGGSGEGRAGMHYRDLIPGRLGGRYIASHITIAEGGPVSDWVHYHRIAFQMIFVRSGWVRVVYQDQGEPFVMESGDMVLQPPGIRHRVLESSPGLEVIEISCPALHETFADHDLSLPSAARDPARTFAGQRFLRHVAAAAPWTSIDGFETQETAMREATGGLADVRLLKPGNAIGMALSEHAGELVFGFVLWGSAHLDFEDGFALGPCDAFVIPPGEPWALVNASPDFRLLHVTTSGF